MIGALGMVIARNAVHSALWLVVTMLCLGFMYVMNSAPFLGAVQIIVYTGAIMMLFLFVLMLVGRDASDSLIETLRGQRVAAILLGVGFAVLVATGLARSLGDIPAVGLAAANANGNVPGPRRPALHPVRVRVRGHLGAADHGRGRRDGAGPRGARQGGHGRPGHPDDRALPAGQLPGRRSPAPASTPTPCRSPRRPGCRTATARERSISPILPVRELTPREAAPKGTEK